MDRPLSNPPDAFSRVYLCSLLASGLAPTSSSEARAAAGAGASAEVAASAASAKPTGRAVTAHANMAELAQPHLCSRRCAPFLPALPRSPSHVASGRGAPGPRVVLGDATTEAQRSDSDVFVLHLVSAVRLLPPHTGRRAQPSCRPLPTPSRRRQHPGVASPCSLLSLMLCL